MTHCEHKYGSIVLASLALGVSLGLSFGISRGQATHVCVHALPDAVSEAPAPEVATLPLDIPAGPPQGLIPATAGQPVQIGQRVVARWRDGSWWDARITAVDGDLVTAAWLDGSAPTALPRHHVAPLDAPATALAANGLALCARDASTRWSDARAAVVGGAAVAVYGDGMMQVLAGQCIPAEAVSIGFAE